MYKRSPLLLLLLAAYVFAPQMSEWLTDATRGWYKPFVVWLLIIIAAYFYQKNKSSGKES